MRESAGGSPGGSAGGSPGESAQPRRPGHAVPTDRGPQPDGEPAHGLLQGWSAATRSSLVADAERLLSDWVAPTTAEDVIRRRVQAFLARHGDAAASRELRTGHLTASSVLLDVQGSEVLLTLHALAGQWLQLGGHLEPGDPSLAGAAAREAREESGIRGILVDPDPLTVDWHRVQCRDAAGVPGPSAHLDLTFLGIAPAGARHRISDESLDLRWFPVDALPLDTDDTVRRCVELARRRPRQDTSTWIRSAVER